ncbi:Lipocalin-like domain-containing protein [Bisporella sp. PMI_857]|nr:Lipocalin-like domain-containing protein [Bisporella sp. PMI_857]
MLHIEQSHTALLGCWKLTKFQVFLGDGPDSLLLTQPHGTETFGRIMFSKEGWMSVSLTPPERAKPLATSEWTMASDQDVLWVARAYTTYMGAFKIYERNQEMILECKVDISLDPSWIGSAQKRRVTLSEKDGKKFMTLKPMQFLVMPGGTKTLGMLEWEKIDDPSVHKESPKI